MVQLGGGGRHYTISLAVSASCIDNAQNLETATLLAGAIARAATVFCVDEVVVIDDSKSGEGRVGKAAALLARVLQYLETPQYLRRALLPMHADLRHVGLLPPLDAPHHMRAAEWGPYREGVVTASDTEAGSFVDIGLDKEAHCEDALRVGQRVTLRLGERPQLQAVAGRGQVYAAQAVLPGEPRQAGGLYWGYGTRIAAGLADVWGGCPFEGGYDLRIGTSEHGVDLAGGNAALPRFRHALVAFGGPEGLEASAAPGGAGGAGGAHGSGACGHKPAEADTAATAAMFDMYVNTCPGQGSRTIRTEEAILISMAALQAPLRAAGLRRAT